MALRSGTRVLEPRAALEWLARDFGEDWVVPKAPVRYVVARGIAASVLLTAYGQDGQVLGERLFAHAAEGEAVMQRLRHDGLVEPWRQIPEDAPSAARFLDTEVAAP